MREELAADFCVVNGENAADGAGITPRIADRILAAGAEVITLGNHVWRRPEIGPYLAESERVIRPANVSSGSPGQGLTVCPAADGSPVAVINLLGHVPTEGESVEVDGHRLVAEKVQGRRIGRVRIAKVTGDPVEPADAPPA